MTTNYAAKRATNLDRARRDKRSALRARANALRTAVNNYLAAQESGDSTLIETQRKGVVSLACILVRCMDRSLDEYIEDRRKVQRA